MVPRNLGGAPDVADDGPDRCSRPARMRIVGPAAVRTRGAAQRAESRRSYVDAKKAYALGNKRATHDCLRPCHGLLSDGSQRALIRAFRFWTLFGRARTYRSGLASPGMCLQCTRTPLAGPMLCRGAYSQSTKHTTAPLNGLTLTIAPHRHLHHARITIGRPTRTLCTMHTSRMCLGRLCAQSWTSAVSYVSVYPHSCNRWGRCLAQRRICAMRPVNGRRWLA